MRFTYEEYVLMIKRIIDAGYEIANYRDYSTKCLPCILRHDVDFSLKKAYELALYEHDNGIHSTFFVLISSELYNVFSIKNRKIIRDIASMGHEVGLHFDESCYDNGNVIIDSILFEKEILQEVLGAEVCCVSMHEPSERFLDSDVEIPGMINSYSKEFFGKLKYCSDSRRLWRDHPEDFVSQNECKGLHILTHPV